MSTADVEIAACLKAGKSFILDAGAGSGKTYSLVLALNDLCSSTASASLAKSGQRIACITFTKVARDQIIERTSANPLLRVSTIHDFLWSVLQPHQAALKAAVQLYNGDLKIDSTRKRDAAELTAALPHVPVTYSDRGSNLLEGRLHHDDLLSVGRIVFRNNALLGKLVAAKYPCILVDEYQDTSLAVVEILLERILKNNGSSFVLGLFGDKLQNIYHSGEHVGIGEIPAHMALNLTPIIKQENRRCSLAVIKVLNHIRTDIQQFPSADNVGGDAAYLNVSGKDPNSALAEARKFLTSNLGWELSGEGEKELFLTHKMIARKGGYQELLDVFKNRGDFYKDQLLNGEDARIGFFLKHVEPIAETWATGNSGKTLSLLKQAGYRLLSEKSKIDIKSALDKLVTLTSTATIRETLLHLQTSKLFPLNDDLSSYLNADGNPANSAPLTPEAQEREEKDQLFFKALFALRYDQIRSFSTFFNDHTPFATKHGVKGDQYKDVFVILDDKGARWNIYSFDKYLSGEDEIGNPGRFQKSRNVFYVCCSRAKRYLAVIDFSPRTTRKAARVAELFCSNRVFYLP